MPFTEAIRRWRSSHTRRRIIVAATEPWRRRALFIAGGLGVRCFAVHASLRGD